MTQLEQIKAEIGRRFEDKKVQYGNTPIGNVTAHYLKGETDALESLLSFIESMEKEQKACICPQCLNYNEKEETCNFPHGGLNCLINENGVCECNEFEDADAYVEKAMKLIREKLDIEKEYKKWWDSISGKINVEHIMEWYMHETARHFFELGKNAK